MKQATSRMLFAFWDATRGERATPEWRGMDPTRMRHLLPDCFTVAQGGGEVRIRSVGTRCAALLRPAPGSLDALLCSRLGPGGESLLDLVSSEGAGVVAGLEGDTDEGSPLSLELLLLPLRPGRTDGPRVVGSLVHDPRAAWRPGDAVRQLRVRSLRVIRTGNRLPVPPATRRRPPGLVVIEGGRSAGIGA